MKHTAWVFGACLMGGLMALVLGTGLDAPIAVAGENALPAGPGGVVINEVEYDPLQGGTDTAYEWLELFNGSAAPITLTGWTVEDNSSSDTIPDVTIPPQGFVVVAATASFSTNYPSYSGTIVYLGGSIGGGLSNAGDHLVLRDDGGVAIDALSWEGDTSVFDCGGHPCGSDLPAGHSLEREPAGFDTDGPGDFVERASPTPGTGLPPQVGAPDIVVGKTGPITATPGSTITYYLSLHNAGTATATQTVLTDALPSGVNPLTQTSPFPFTRQGRELVWQLGDVAAGASHRITVTVRVTDTATGLLVNAVSATTTASETVTANNSAAWSTTVVVEHAPRDVVINEVAWMGTQADGGHEWIELLNNTERTIDLHGWVLRDHGGTLATLAGAIPAGGTTLLARETATFSGTAPLIDQLFIGSLRNAGEVITLTDATGAAIDTANAELGYDNGWVAGDADLPRYTMERVDPGGPDLGANWCTNDGVTRNGEDAAGNPINGTPGAQNSCYAVPGLALAKLGPPIVTPGFDLTCRLLVSNTGSLTATGVAVTDTLPGGLSLVTQTSRFPFTQPTSDTLVWLIGDLPSATLASITLTLHADEALTGTAVNLAVATDAAGRRAEAAWSAPATPYVRLYAAHPYALQAADEAVALINLGPATASVGDWQINDGGSSLATLPPAAVIPPRAVVWLAQDADRFCDVFGFEPDFAVTGTVHAVPLLGGKWPGFANSGDEVLLLEGNGLPVDTLVYGGGAPAAGWLGPPVPYDYSGYAAGQILYRKLGQSSGLPVPDTDSAADWAQDPDDPIDGRRLRYPGWDLEELFYPVEVSATAALTLAVAPDGALEMVSRTIAAAQHTLRIEAYTLESVALYQVISDRVQAGVVVTLLLESHPVGGIDAAEEWIVQRLHAPPSSTVYFIGAETPRYRLQHAKFVVVDDRIALVSSDNFGESSMPSDPAANGTLGHRGFVVATDSPGVVARLAEIFRRDCDPLHHVDVVPYDGSFAPPTPLPPPDWTTYTAPFTAPLVTTATHVTVLHAPENALRDRDSLLGLLGRAGGGDAVAVMQMNEPFTWTAQAGTAGLNPRLQALVAAARRGASVRVLLDDYYGGANSETCRLLNQVAEQEGLTLACRLANVTGLGIHAKVFAVSVGEERWIHVGSINGTENSNKRNREVALQFESQAAYARLLSVFEHDWERGHGPYIYHVRLPLVTRDYVAPASYPLVTEAFINPQNQAGQPETPYEWIELFNPGPPVTISGWTLGDAIDAGDYGDGRYRFPDGAHLLRGQVVVAAACATHFSARYGFNPDYEWTGCDASVPDLAPAGAWEGFGLALGNASDEVLLLDAGGALVDSVAWAGADRAGVVPYPLDPGDSFPSGATLKRYPPSSDRDDCSRDFYISYSPSPGHVSGG